MTMVENKKEIYALQFYTLLTGIMQSVFRVVFNLYLRDIGTPNNIIGNITSANLLGAAILGLIVSTTADVIGRKKVVMLAVIIFPLSSVLMLCVSDYTLIYLLSFIRGGFQIVGFTVILSLLVSITGERNRVKYFGINFGLNMGSGVFGNLAGGILGDTFGLSQTMFLAMLIFSLAIIPLSKIKVVDERKHIRNIFNFSGFNKNQKTLLLLHYSSTLAVGFGAGLFIHFGNLIFKDLFDMSTTSIGIALSIAQLGTAVGGILAKKFGKKYGPFQFKFICQLMVVPLIISLAFVRDPFIFTILYATRFVFMNIATPIMNSIINSYIPHDKISTITGINSLINNSIRSVAALLFGYIVGNSVDGYTTLFAISAVFYCVNSVISFIMLKLYKNDEAILNLFKH